MIAKAADRRLFGGGLSSIRKWLAAIPDVRVRSNPDLAICKGWLLALTGEMASAEDYTVAAEAAVPVSGSPSQGKL